MFLQFSDGRKGIHRISCESADRFCNDKVNLSRQGIGNHLIETGAMFGVGGADVLVYVIAVFDTI